MSKSLKAIFVIFFATLLSLTACTKKANKISAAGATFPYPLYAKWISDYKTKAPGPEITYQSIGSGGGVRQLIEGTIDFGASDDPMKAEDLAKSKWPIIQVPTTMGGVVLAYNLPSANGSLNLSGEVLAQIFLGKIAKWDDIAIKTLNPTLNLPSKDILSVHRADGSGTTAIFTDYLSKMDGEWKEKLGKGKSINWPNGIGGKGNEGVTAMIKQTEGAIGYVGLEFALKNSITYANIKNAQGDFIHADIKSVSAAAEGITSFDMDKIASITNSPAPGAYPISAFTFLLLPKKGNAALEEEIKKFVSWCLTEGQASAGSLSYSALPTSMATAILEAVKNF